LREYFSNGKKDCSDASISMVPISTKIYDAWSILSVFFCRSWCYGLTGHHIHSIPMILSFTWFVGCWVSFQRSIPKTNGEIDSKAWIKIEFWVEWLSRRGMNMTPF
jgi:hypothetical protein